MMAMMWGMKHVMHGGQGASQFSQAGLPVRSGITSKERLAELKTQQPVISHEIAELGQGTQEAVGAAESFLRPRDEDSRGRP